MKPYQYLLKAIKRNRNLSTLENEPVPSYILKDVLEAQAYNRETDKEVLNYLEEVSI